MAVKIQLRRGTAAEWASENPVLDEGEFGLETDTSRFKIGNGTDVWAVLSYSSLPSNAVDSGLLDAKGDLIVASADNTAGRLAVGANGYVLTANSANPLGVGWAALPASGVTEDEVIALAIALGG
jgi:hypothetical protein